MDAFPSPPNMRTPVRSSIGSATSSFGTQRKSDDVAAGDLGPRLEQLRLQELRTESALKEVEQASDHLRLPLNRPGLFERNGTNTSFISAADSFHSAQEGFTSGEE